MLNVILASVIVTVCELTLNLVFSLVVEFDWLFLSISFLRLWSVVPYHKKDEFLLLFPYGLISIPYGVLALFYLRGKKEHDKTRERKIPSEY